MTPRENLLSLLKRQGYEFINPEFSLCPHLNDVYIEREKTTLPYIEYFNMPWRHIGGLTQTDEDLTRFKKYHPDLREGDVIDGWGVGHRKTPTSMHMTLMLHPLENADSEEQFLEYPLPVYDRGLVEKIRLEVDEIHKKGLAAVGNMQCTIWEAAWYIRGMEALMMDMMSDEPIAEILLDRITAMSQSMAEIYAMAGVDILFVGDDVGMQQSVMMSDSLYCEWLKPRLSQVIGAAKKINPSLVVFYHSCGYVLPFIKHFIESGVDVLNPVQPECMPFEQVFAEYGGAISFHGAIGTQTVMPFGTPQEVRSEIKRCLNIAGSKGGLWPAPTHLLEPEVPWENVLAYVEECKNS